MSAKPGKEGLQEPPGSTLNRFLKQESAHTATALISLQLRQEMMPVVTKWQQLGGGLPLCLGPYPSGNRDSPAWPCLVPCDPRPGWADGVGRRGGRFQVGGVQKQP